MLHPILYKRTSTGATQTWQIEQEGERYRTISGQIDGKKVESGWQVAVAKNVGRSNETTPIQQADLEIEATYTKKLAQGGYHDSLTAIDEAKFFKPMLAKSYDDHPVTDFSSLFCQPKLDGVRCIATVDGLWTRQGKPIDAVPHVHEALAPFFADDPTLIFDGELYADKLADNFNEIISLVRKKNPDAKRLALAADTIEYHIYDFPSHNGPFVDRCNALADLLSASIHSCLKWVNTNLVDKQETLDRFFAEYLEVGYEGQIIRYGNSPYENKRSKNLLKRKSFTDTEYKVISISEGVGNRAGMAGFITYELGDGRTFKSGIRGSHDYCKQLLIDAALYVGGTGTVQSDGLTPDGIPRFPVTTALYEDGRDL